MQAGAVAVAAKNERSRPLLQHVGEILGAHEGRAFVHVGRAGNFLQVPYTERPRPVTVSRLVVSPATNVPIESSQIDISGIEQNIVNIAFAMCCVEQHAGLAQAPVSAEFGQYGT